jgi:hypothetical protein
MQALAKCVKAIQGMTGKDRNSQAAQDLQRIIDATQVCIQTNLHQFEETITPDYICKMQRVSRVQTPVSTSIPHTNDNRQIMRSMQMQAPIPRVPRGIPTIKPISALHAATITGSSNKSSTLAAELSKQECQRKQ